MLTCSALARLSESAPTLDQNGTYANSMLRSPTQISHDQTH